MSIGSRASAALRRQLPVAPYEVEQSGFAVNAVPHLVRMRPDVVVVQDVVVAKAWHRIRELIRARFQILFVNGSPWPPPYDFADVVQHLTGPSLEAALAANEPPSKNVLLAYGVPIRRELTGFDRIRARRHFGIPEDSKVVLSVGALNVRHKRHDHLIREVARLGESRPHLMIVGAEDPESGELRRMAHDLLGDKALISTVAPADMEMLYAASDVFALASVVEGFGLAYVEALASGLPVIAHNGSVQRWVTGDSATLVDMTRQGDLAAALRVELRRLASRDDASAHDRHQDVYRRFSWDALGDRYIELVEATAR